MLSKLNIRLRTLTPPGSRGSDWEPKMPSNYMQLQKQSSSIKALLCMGSRSPPSPLNTAINQILKACQIGIQSTAILEKGLSELRTANEKQQQKRTRSKRQISHEGSFSAPEAHELFEQLEVVIEALAPPRTKKAFTTFTAAYTRFTKVRYLWKRRISE